MKAFLIFVCVTTALATKSDYHKTTKCYQCAYNPADVTVDHVQVPRTVYDEIQVPRTVYDEVQVPRVVYDDVTVTRLEYDEVEVPRIVYDEVQVPRVAYETTQVPRVVEDYVQPKGKKSYHYHGYAPVRVTRTVYETVTNTYLTYDTESRSYTTYDVEQVSRVVHDTQQVSRTVYDTQQVSRTVYDTQRVSRTEYDTHNVTRTVPGGWERCEHGFTHDEAIAYGIDTWDCHDNCYLRNEGQNIYRGCYKGEYGVNPSLLGCNEQAGATWCFCEGNLCNNRHLADA